MNLIFMTLLTLLSLVACGVYYYVWIWLLPRWKGYRVRHEKVILDGGEITHVLVKVKLSQLAEWDRKHDAAGAVVENERNDDSSGVLQDQIQAKNEP